MHGEGWTGRTSPRRRWTCKVEACAWYPSHAPLKCTGITTARITGRPRIEAAYTDELIYIYPLPCYIFIRLVTLPAKWQ
jgi:hypothetical protein